MPNADLSIESVAIYRARVERTPKDGSELLIIFLKLCNHSANETLFASSSLRQRILHSGEAVLSTIADMAVTRKETQLRALYIPFVTPNILAVLPDTCERLTLVTGEKLNVIRGFDREHHFLTETENLGSAGRIRVRVGYSNTAFRPSPDSEQAKKQFNTWPTGVAEISVARQEVREVPYPVSHDNMDELRKRLETRR